MKKQPLFVTKASGQKAPFREEKLKRSLLHSGASEEAAEAVIDEVKGRLYAGISTKKIYQTAFRLLKKFAGATAARYRLKQALMELGPSGYPFERYVAELLKFQGYRVKVGVTVQGYCVNHEVDIVAEKDDRHFMVECKFHNRQGYYSDVKVPLYIDSRFRDVEKKWKTQDGHRDKFHQGLVVTNTRFSADAMQYARCVGLQLVGWDYPERGSLKDWIDTSGLHPVTCLTTLTQTEKERLLEMKVVLCRELRGNETVLKKIGLNEPRIRNVMKECSELCAAAGTALLY
ncbi:MAG TPA: restriction endonuclease [Chitinophagales bacterium]|nr:restriction endonuclease [Chitinophagales bacterium]